MSFLLGHVPNPDTKNNNPDPLSENIAETTELLTSMVTYLITLNLDQ